MQLNNKIALVPLDSRPCNSKFPVKLAAAAGFDVLVPPKELLDNFKDPANTAKVIDWLKNTSAACSGLIVSSDMLSYGGLIASRSSKTSLEEARNNLSCLLQIRKDNPEIKIFAFSIITRLSITAGSEKEAEIWRKLFKSAALARKAEDLYRTGEGLPREVIEEFISVRKRNHEINRDCIELAGSGVIDYLVLGKEDSAAGGLQTGEVALLERQIGSDGLNEKVLIMNGADELSCVLTARQINERFKDSPKITVRYSSKNEKAAAIYEDSYVADNVAQHISAAGALMAEKISDADIVLFINLFDDKQKDLLFEAPKLKEGAQLHLLKNFCSEIVMVKDLGKKAAVADINYCNGADVQFLETLRSVFRLDLLDAYAGWNTASNSIGCAVAQAVLPANKPFLLERFVDDLGYQAVVRPQINKYLEENGISKYDLGTDDTAIETITKQKMADWSKEFFSKLEIGNWELDIALPWPRTFETDCDIILQ
ncbi:MAG: DUF4127 family protein [Candidatus Margulisiibacteriota bacterium]